MQVRDILPEYSILSTEAMPTLDADQIGYTVEHTDTGDRFRWTGFVFVETHTEGAQVVHSEEFHHNVLSEYFHHLTGVSSTLAVATVGDGTEYTIEVEPGDGLLFTAGEALHIGSAPRELTLPVIVSIATDVLTLDRRLDYAHAIGATVEVTHLDLTSEVGTLAAPISYKLIPPVDTIWDVTRLILSMAHGTSGDLGLFGNLPALTNGVVIRVYVSGQYGTFTNWKTNQDIKDDVFDVEFDSRSGGGGTAGTTVRGTFTKLGAILELDGSEGDFLEILVQDDLTGLTPLRIKGQGYWNPIGTHN